MNRRDFLRFSAVGGGALVLGPGFWRNAYAAPAVPGPSPHGAMSGSPDANGLLLPAGFSSRIIARTGDFVPGTGYVWHTNPDGGACFAAPEGGWVYVSNSESIPGGVSAIRFDGGGTIVDAYSILSDTSIINCAGGPTPWGTWLSCEEYDGGRVWECNPFQPSQGVARPSLGTFTHEAVAVDPNEGRLYLTEDRSNGRFYRFTPKAWPSLTGGTLEAARFTSDPIAGGKVSWIRVSATLSAALQPTAFLTTAFRGGEGCWYDDGTVYFTTKGDNRVWAYTVASSRLEVIYDDNLYPDSPLTGVDNVVVSRFHDLYVVEDGGDMQLCIITPERVVAPFLQLLGHEGSEMTGPAFSPDGHRLYFSSQRGSDGRGVTFEVSGPFRS